MRPTISGFAHVIDKVSKRRLRDFRYLESHNCLALVRSKCFSTTWSLELLSLSTCQYCCLRSEYAERAISDGDVSADTI